jgi:hypothetical protein
MIEIRKQADGYAIYRDSVFVVWCYTEERANKLKGEMI